MAFEVSCASRRIAGAASLLRGSRRQNVAKALSPRNTDVTGVAAASHARRVARGATKAGWPFPPRSTLNKTIFRAVNAIHPPGSRAPFPIVELRTAR